jgi:cyclohexyl-isocyanide hydratase
MHVVMLPFPYMTQLDLTRPYDVLARLEELTLHLVWKCLESVIDSGGLQLNPTVTFANCPQADILFVPGGPGQIALMEDEDVLSFLRHQAEGGRRRAAIRPIR